MQSACSVPACEGAEAVPTHPAIVAGVAGAVVDVILAVRPREPVNAGAVIAIDLVHADPVVAARVGGALVNIGLAVSSGVTYHTASVKKSLQMS